MEYAVLGAIPGPDRGLRGGEIDAVLAGKGRLLRCEPSTRRRAAVFGWATPWFGRCHISRFRRGVVTSTRRWPAIHPPAAEYADATPHRAPKTMATIAAVAHTCGNDAPGREATAPRAAICARSASPPETARGRDCPRKPPAMARSWAPSPIDPLNHEKGLGGVKYEGGCARQSPGHLAAGSPARRGSPTSKADHAYIDSPPLTPPPPIRQ